MPQLIATKFVTNTVLGQATRMYRSGDLACWQPNRTVEFLGQIDTQVKLCRLHIKLGQIESRLAEATNLVRNSAEVLCNNAENKHLVAFYIPSCKEGHCNNVKVIR